MTHLPTLVQGRPTNGVPAITAEVLAGSPRRITERREPVLRRACAEVTELGTDRWGGLIADMFATMWVAEGCGLAANQVGVDARLFVYDLTDEDGRRHLGHVFNPVVEVVQPGDTIEADEGCLSVPGAAHR